jgi:hypothetical protein
MCAEAAKLESLAQTTEAAIVPESKVISQFQAVHGLRYCYDSLDYTGKAGRVTVRCREHGDFTLSVANHIEGSGCPICLKTTNRRKVEASWVIDPAEALNSLSNRYPLIDFSAVLSVSKVTDIFAAKCPTHGEYPTTVRASLLNRGNYGCKKCAIDAAVKKANEAVRVKNLKEQRPAEEIINMLLEVHGEKYTYELPERLNKNTKIFATCHEHGSFLIRVSELLKGNGCKECFNERNKLTYADFLSRCVALYGDTYVYGDYTLLTRKVKFICPKHGLIQQRAAVHLRGGGCPLCSGGSISKGETDFLSFVSEITNEPILTNDRTILEGLELDIVIPTKQFAIEYCGTYWHSDRFRDDPLYHKTKLDETNKKGLSLITLFEDEWKYKKEAVVSVVKRKLEEAQSDFGVMPCTIDSTAARAFMAIYSLTDCTGETGLVVYGSDGKVIAAAEFSVTYPSEITLTRYCSVAYSGLALRSVVDFLSVLGNITVSVDLRWFTGKSFTDLGFSTIKTIQPKFYYVKGEKRLHSHEINIPRDKQSPVVSREATLRQLGWARLYDCGHLIMRKPLSGPSV